MTTTLSCSPSATPSTTPPVTPLPSPSNGVFSKTLGHGLVRSAPVCPSSRQSLYARLSAALLCPPRTPFYHLLGRTSLVLHHHRLPLATVDRPLDLLEMFHPLEPPLHRHLHPCHAISPLYHLPPGPTALRSRCAVPSRHLQSAMSLAILHCFAAILSSP